MDRLKGMNRVGEFRDIAGCLVSRILQQKGVGGIIYTGGLVRGFADKYSDVDIIVLLDKKSKELRRRLRKIGLDMQKSSHVDIDLEIYYLADFEKRNLNEIHKWDFSHAEIVFDPHGRIRRLLRNKTRATERFWLKRIVVCGEYLMWYCCPPEEGTTTVTETWIERGDLISAHYCLNYSIDLLLKIVFALNKELLPAPKWRIYYSYKLNWLPSDYKKRLEEVITVENLSAIDLNRRLRALRDMWHEILLKIKNETGLTPDLISKLYVKNLLQQT